MEEYIYIGKIVNTHGIKGEIRILSDFEKKDSVFVVGMPIYIGRKKEKEIGINNPDFYCTCFRCSCWYSFKLSYAR